MLIFWCSWKFIVFSSTYGRKWFSVVKLRIKTNDAISTSFYIKCCCKFCSFFFFFFQLAKILMCVLNDAQKYENAQNLLSLMLYVVIYLTNLSDIWWYFLLMTCYIIRRKVWWVSKLNIICNINIKLKKNYWHIFCRFAYKVSDSDTSFFLWNIILHWNKSI